METEMLKVITDKQAINRAQKEFMRKFEQIADEKIFVMVGHMGASERRQVSWSNHLGIWYCFEKKPVSRYWNAFGTENPAKKPAVSIRGEINFPLNGINRNIQGAFAQSSSGKVLVVHRGRIGGGKKGIGKTLFEEKYRGEWTTVDDRGAKSHVALIGELNSPRFVKQVKNFIFEVDRIKSLVSSQVQTPRTINPRHEFKKDSLMCRLCAKRATMDA